MPMPVPMPTPTPMARARATGRSTFLSLGGGLGRRHSHNVQGLAGGRGGNAAHLDWLESAIRDATRGGREGGGAREERGGERGVQAGARERSAAGCRHEEQQENCGVPSSRRRCNCATELGNALQMLAAPGRG